MPHLPQLDGTDSHLYFGWYHGEERDLPGFAAAVPRMVRFVSEFGAQAVPDRRRVHGAGATGPTSTGTACSGTTRCRSAVFDERVPPADYATFDGWRDATQRYQAGWCGTTSRRLRRLKYRPTGGFCLFSLPTPTRPSPGRLLDHDRAAKLAYHASSRPAGRSSSWPTGCPGAVRPARPSPSTSTSSATAGSPSRAPRSSAVLSWPGGDQGWRWQGAIAGRRLRARRHRALVVPDAPGPLVLDLDLVAGDVAATNRYESRITLVIQRTRDQVRESKRRFSSLAFR